jgi:hypothetical protein
MFTHAIPSDRFKTNNEQMKTKTFILVLITIIFSAVSLHAQQVEYHYFDNIDGVRIDYRWSRANLLNRNSDAVLYLQLTNENDHAVKIVYTVGFYRDDQVFMESENSVLCLNPGQRRRGSRSDMRYSAEGLNMEMTEEEGFSWDFVVFDAEEASCD